MWFGGTNRVCFCLKDQCVLPVHSELNVCGSTESVVTTVYTSATPTERKRLVPKHGDLVPRQDSGCTVTTTLTTTYGVTETYIPANKTSTFKDYTAFTMKTVSKTSSGGHAYVIATATATTSVHCGALTVTNNATMSTTTQDSRCAPSAMVSQYSGFGLDYLEETPDSGGAIYVTDASDASSCCQICADAVDCASSAWDIRSNQCRLQFDVDQHSGELVCGQIGVIAVNEDGPLHPMAPGTGWYLAAMCGTLEEVNGLPDDGS